MLFEECGFRCKPSLKGSCDKIVVLYFQMMGVGLGMVDIDKNAVPNSLLQTVKSIFKHFGPIAL